MTTTIINSECLRGGGSGLGADWHLHMADTCKNRTWHMQVGFEICFPMIHPLPWELSTNIPRQTEFSTGLATWLNQPLGIYELMLWRLSTKVALYPLIS